MDKINQIFKTMFSTWGIELPPDNLASRRRGKIMKAGWVIWYLFGSEEKGEYLDVYSSHRMTSDSHVRVYSSGEVEDLPAIRELLILTSDPEKNKQAEEEYFAHNQRVAELLEEKGFGFSGDEPGLMIVNRFLHVNKEKK